MLAERMSARSPTKRDRARSETADVLELYPESLTGSGGSV